MPMREIILDTETTGLDPSNGDRLVEVGAIEMVERVATGRRLHLYFNPQRDMPTAAEAVHGLTADFLADKPLFAEKAREVWDFLGDSPVVAHNAAFDWRFLAAEFTRCGYHLPYERMVDTLELARARFPGAKHSLDALCARFGIERGHRVLHGALIDAELLADVYVELTGGRQIGLALAVDAVARTGRTARAGGDIPGRRPRYATVPEAEAAAHGVFVAAIPQAMWLGEA